MTFAITIADTGILIRRETRKLLRRSLTPIGGWSALTGAAGRATAALLSMVERGEATGDGVEIRLTHEVAAKLPASLAASIGLPPLVPLSVTLNFEGKMTDRDGFIRARWYDDALATVRPKRTGCIVGWGERHGRLSSPLFALIEAVDAYNRTDGQSTEGRVEAWMPVQHALADATGQPVDADDYMTHLTLYQAGSLSLDVRAGNDGPDFAPIPMGRERASGPTDGDASVPDSSEGDPAAVDRPPDENAAALLPRELQAAFLQRFNQEGETPPAYVLGRGEFMVVDPDLRKALDVVRSKRRAPRAEREDFVRNPRAAFARALGGRTPTSGPEDESEAANAEEELDIASGLLVETAQYAERVIGLGVWAKPDIPWLKAPSGQWMPERFPVQIGGTTITLDQRSTETLTDAWLTATAACEAELSHEGRALETVKVGEALRNLGIVPCEPEQPQKEQPEEDGDAAQPDPQAGASSHAGPEASPSEVTDRQVLQIHQNFDGVDYLMAHPHRYSPLPQGFPSDLTRSQPKPHQEVGFDWLCSAWKAGWPGVLLADDMGLGKTFQSLAFLAWLRKSHITSRQAEGASHRPILVVAPTALLRNWIEEAERHLQQGTLGERIDAFGSSLSRLRSPTGDGWSEEDSLDVARLRKADWVLTTYETLAQHHRAFARVAFSAAIFDEAQKIKNPGTVNTQAAKAMNVDFCLMMTGTPIENRLADLWCIVDRAVPGYLGALKDFSKTYEDAGEDRLEELKAKLDGPDVRTPALMLRRMKSEILSALPERRRVNLPAEMPLAQAAAYGTALREAMDGERSHGAMLKAIHDFRGLSLHPDGVADLDPFDARAVATWIGRSARLSETVKALDDIAKRGEKALLFLEDLAMQSAFARAMATWFGLKREPGIINGKVPGEKRLAIVDAFQACRPGFDLLVLSPKAAGVGLTITAANHVIHLSRWWNPAVEDQCNDRCYRIGQDKPVTIHVPQAIHPTFGEASFDLTLDRLLERKRSLSHAMLRPPIEDGDVEALFGGMLRPVERAVRG
ncbi:DEAD/DEAH box helicase [Aurantimonas coralicida]|uniref:DEAD/DEAH box helicase n=1 Tax=Aurantimonas coralicida TaxID=182270 RepID=UPI001E4534C4|nr:DEAD/DEAH box helicase [Aurantimonas coralicida]MCD1645307.1 DEAD/DEAH box helicase [Aurantimonas coralicida]